MTPVQLEVIIHHYYKRGLITDTPFDDMSAAYQDAYRWLRANEMLKYCEDDDSFVTTSKGVVFVEALTRIPLPTPTWKVNVGGSP